MKFVNIGFDLKNSFGKKDVKQTILSGCLVFLILIGLGSSNENGGGNEPKESNSSYILRVDKFGDGLVVDDGSIINCGENSTSI